MGTYAEKYPQKIIDIRNGLTESHTGDGDVAEDVEDRVLEIADDGYRHGLAGWYPDGDYSSDADWCNGVGDRIRRLEEQLEVDDASIFDIYTDAHGHGLNDGGHNNDEDNDEEENVSDESTLCFMIGRAGIAFTKTHDNGGTTLHVGSTEEGSIGVARFLFDEAGTLKGIYANE